MAYRHQDYDRDWDESRERRFPDDRADRDERFGSRDRGGYDTRFRGGRDSDYGSDDRYDRDRRDSGIYGAEGRGQGGYEGSQQYAGSRGDVDRDGARGWREAGYPGTRQGDDPAGGRGFGGEGPGVGQFGTYNEGSDSQRRGRMAEGEHRGKGPKDYTRSDQRIQEDACDRLADDSHLDASNITVAVSKGEVTLDGTVGSRADKRRAEDCVDGCSGVRHVQNNLRVQESGSSGTEQTRNRAKQA